MVPKNKTNKEHNIRKENFYHHFHHLQITSGKLSSKEEWRL